MHLTGPDNPLLCHYLCYYLKWVYDNEMFTTGNTLNCSYSGREEEISEEMLLSQRNQRIRLWLFCQVPSLRPQAWTALHHGTYSHLWWRHWQ